MKICLLIILTVISLGACCTPKTQYIENRQTDTLYVVKTFRDTIEVSPQAKIEFLDSVKISIKPFEANYDTLIVSSDKKVHLKAKFRITASPDSVPPEFTVYQESEKTEQIPVITKHERVIQERPWYEWFIIAAIALISFIVGFGIGKLK